MQRSATTATGTATYGAPPARSALRTFLTLHPAKVKPSEVVLFCRQLASFVRVGIPVTTAIHTFAEQATSKRMREACASLVEILGRGGRLSEGMAAHPLAFPAIVVDMVRSAEATGNLDVVLVQAARHIEREASARQKIRAAMTYPTIIAGLAVVISLGMVIFVLPQFRDLYRSLNVSMPGLLVGILNFSGYVGDHLLMIAAGLLLLVLAAGWWLRTPRGRYALDGLMLRLPLIAPLVRASTTERFCRTLGDMLGAGVPISQTYGVVIDNVRNRVFKAALTTVGPAMAAGEGFYRPLRATGVFSPAVIQMIRVGEETGHLDQNLAECADMHEEELDYRIKRMTAILEPALILLVGLIVGFVAVSMVTSIYSLVGNYR